MAKQKFYAVHKGNQPGVYTTWAECQAQTKGFKGAKFKAFATENEAKHAVEHGWDSSVPAPKDETPAETVNAAYIKDSLSVDAACAGNPGAMEYQCVRTDTNEQVFASPVYSLGTNNIGEFLAIVDALRHLRDIGDTTTPIYSDSVSALSWIRKKSVRTTLEHNNRTDRLWHAVRDAETWLHENEWTNPVLKWNTKEWGESKADYGRK